MVRADRAARLLQLRRIPDIEEQRAIADQLLRLAGVDLLYNRLTTAYAAASMSLTVSIDCLPRLRCSEDSMTGARYSMAFSYC
jgi:hypothetical protein